MFSAAILLPLLVSQTHPCADSSLYAVDPDFWEDGGWEETSGDECDTEESYLFSKPAERTRSTRPSNRASFSMAHKPGGELQSIVRQQAKTDGWSHRLEIRDDTLTRRRLSKDGNGWRVTAGDLDDPDLPIWPVGLPRRTLPRGWRRASDPRDAGYGLSAPRPQGFAAGVLQPHWKVWTARAWNPVETGEEPPWNPSWNLRHASTGISASFPWTVSTQFTETRITREATDSVAEQQWAASVASPYEDFLVVGAVEKTRQRKKSGWALATAWHHRFDNASTVDFTARQRDDAWASSWDPAVTELTAAQEAESDSGADREWGAGEFRLAGHVPIPPVLLQWGAGASMDAETWRAWNPAAGTGREGMRGRVDWRAEGVRVKLTGTRRSARAASGSISVYRYLEVETRLEENPKFRVAAFRAWNGSGSLLHSGRTGIFLGVEPTFQINGKELRTNSGLRVETNTDDNLSARGSLGAQWKFSRGWNLDVAASAPCYPRWSAEEMRWRVTVNYAL